MKFETLGISAPILKALTTVNYDKPTPIQEKTIPAAISGQDIMGLAQTGTGKTAAFAIPTLQRLSLTPKHQMRSLILTPTRELAIQIHDSFKTYGRLLPLRSTVIFGGVGQANQVKAIKAGVDILIATPGRLLDLIQQKIINLNTIEIFILDEADRMLDMGFIHDIQKVIALLPSKRQTMLFSATMPKEIEDISSRILKNPYRVSITPVSSTVDSIEQSVVFVDNTHKVDILMEYLQKDKNESFLVFTKTKHGANKVVKELTNRGVSAKAIHGNKSQTARQAALLEFKQMKTQVLVATDIASRGIDIHELKYVVNYDLPDVAETYVHRIGRTGRAGNSGMALTLCNYNDKEMLQSIEKLTKRKIKKLTNAKYPMIDFSPKPVVNNRRSAPKKNSSKRKYS